MDQFPGSPYVVLEQLLDDFQSGRRGREDALRTLDVFDMFLEQWNEDGLQALPVEPEVVPESQSIVDRIAEGLECFGEASRVMRTYFETGDANLADEALSAAYEGHQKLEELYTTTAQRIEDLHNEIG